MGVTALTALMAGTDLPYLCAIALIILGLILLFAKITKPRPISLVPYICLHPAYFFLSTTMVLSTLISVLSIFHASHIDANGTAPKDGQPWRRDLAARVWWGKAPSQEMENGFVYTAQTLGFSYERVQSIQDANFRIWFDSWAYQCKWLTTYAFVSLDPNPSTFGGQTGDISICKLTIQLTRRRPSDYSLMAHEAAHIFAAQPHFGNGLMGQGGGNGTDRFTDKEVETMRNKINASHSSIGPK